MPAPPSTDAAFVAAIKSDLEAADAETAKGTAAYLEIGRKLNARKEQGKRDGTIPHGEWVNWLERNFPPRNGRDRVRRLQRYMQAAEAIGGNHFFFCSSDPQRKIDPIARPLCTPKKVAKEQSIRAISMAI